MHFALFFSARHLSLVTNEPKTANLHEKLNRNNKPKENLSLAVHHEHRKLFPALQKPPTAQRLTGCCTSHFGYTDQTNDDDDDDKL